MYRLVPLSEYSKKHQLRKNENFELGKKRLHKKNK